MLIIVAMWGRAVLAGSRNVACSISFRYPHYVDYSSRGL